MRGRIEFMDMTRLGPKGELRTSTGICCWNGVQLRLPDTRVRLTTTGVPNLGDSGARFAARVYDFRGYLPPGLEVCLVWPGPMGHCAVGATLLTCGDAPCGIEVEINGELGLDERDWPT